jgi:hypothetical protein
LPVLLPALVSAIASKQPAIIASGTTARAALAWATLRRYCTLFIAYSYLLGRACSFVRTQIHRGTERRRASFTSRSLL